MTTRHHHVTRNGEKVSWAWVTATKREARAMRARLRRGLSVRPSDTYDVLTCSDGQCADYVDYLAHIASVPPVTPP
jgi:hypothetical protein